MNALTPRAIFEFFNFLKSDTPDSMSWAIRYLQRNGVTIDSKVEKEILSANKLKNWLCRELAPPKYKPDTVKSLATKMRNAWRVRNHRKNKGTVTLSVSIDRIISDQLTHLCKGEKKSNVISMLIEDNYSNYLNKKHELTKQKEENKAFLQMQKEADKFKKFINQPRSCNIDNPCEELIKQKAINAELRSGISALYTMIYEANEQNCLLSDQDLGLAVKVHTKSLI